MDKAEELAKELRFSFFPKRMLWRFSEGADGFTAFLRGFMAFIDFSYIRFVIQAWVSSCYREVWRSLQLKFNCFKVPFMCPFTR